MYPCSRYFLVPKEKNKILSFHFLPPVPEQTNLAGKRPHNSQNQPKGLSFFFINTWLSWSRHGQSESQDSFKHIFVLANIS